VKVCTKCKKEKGDSEFYSKGLVCILCNKAYQKEYRLLNKDRIKKRDAQYYILNSDHIKERSKNRYDNNTDEILNKQKDYYMRNHIWIDRRNKNYRDLHKEESSLYFKEYRLKHLNERTLLAKRIRQDNWIYISLDKHKRNGIDIRTTQEEIVSSNDIEHCYICGCGLIIGQDKTSRNSPTLDRLNNELFMDVNNTKVVCHSCNVMKGERSILEYLLYLKIIKDTVFVIPSYDKSIVFPRGHKGRRWAKSTLSQHIKRGVNISATILEIFNIYLQTPSCPICGCKLEHGVGKLHSRSPTLDRITNKETDLTIDDLWVICHRCNLSKRQFTLPEWKEYAEKVCKRFNVV
jgi:hypothetical protein